ncbi:uncharacterized protein LACBIDRAFT_330683 [Laccaria bicolor S238N-H82]|uniref:Predicted protein n=1 Tax=Laccaria bicolor (strain S238N-H82 / ATCC MYA-4686) TaxID=486041 RepID=B0DM44_LACBS|nr:uncharacterized protein LACBIDRAFT_330683 [Laccaria bicolor S238N-H82]EDR04501.1 predicted protein [Laccaria bicolor S238N-H82]|eukprot:XP_001885020.1 predicted protein [Laccaria bicolor S238N-H82]
MSVLIALTHVQDAYSPLDAHKFIQRLDGDIGGDRDRGSGFPFCTFGYSRENIAPPPSPPPLTPMPITPPSLTLHHTLSHIPSLPPLSFSTSPTSLHHFPLTSSLYIYTPPSTLSL